MKPTMAKINDGECTWAVADRDGYEEPHGIKARRRVSGAGEFLSGDFCIRHAKLAIEQAERERVTCPECGGHFHIHIPSDGGPEPPHYECGRCGRWENLPLDE